MCPQAKRVGCFIAVDILDCMDLRRKTSGSDKPSDERKIKVERRRSASVLSAVRPAGPKPLRCFHFKGKREVEVQNCTSEFLGPNFALQVCSF